MSTEGRRRSYDLPPPPSGASRPPPAPHHPPSGEKGWRYTLRVPSWSQAQLPDGETAVFYQAGRGDHLAGMTPTRRRVSTKFGPSMQTLPSFHATFTDAGGGDRAAAAGGAAQAQRGPPLQQLCHALPAGGRCHACASKMLLASLTSLHCPPPDTPPMLDVSAAFCMCIRRNENCQCSEGF